MASSDTQTTAPAPMAQPWLPALATQIINKKARDAAFSLAWTDHAKERFEQRDIIMGDVLHVLKWGTVYDTPRPGTDHGSFKYRIEGVSPNSMGKTLRVVVIPQPTPALVLVSVMWAGYVKKEEISAYDADSEDEERK